MIRGHNGYRARAFRQDRQKLVGVVWDHISRRSTGTTSVRSSSTC
jgi:hypothetical protein